MSATACDKCGKDFPNTRALKKHKARKTPCVSGEDDKPKICDRCGKHFSKKTDFDRHKARKTPCGIVLATDLPVDRQDFDHACLCGRRFETVQNLRVHESNCRYVPRADNVEEMKKVLLEFIKKHEGAKAEDSKAATESKKPGGDSAQNIPASSAAGDAKFSAGDSKSSDGDTKSSDNIVSSVIRINHFGNEFMKYVTQEDTLKLMNDIGGPAGGDGRHALPSSKAIKTLVFRGAALLYNREKYLDNITCFMANEKKGIAMVHDSEGWKRQSVKQTIKEITARTIDMLFQQQPFPGEHGIDEYEDIDNCTNLLNGLKNEEEEIKADPPMDIISLLGFNREILKRRLGMLPALDEKMELPDPAKRVIPDFIMRYTVFDAVRAIKNKVPEDDGISLKYASEFLKQQAAIVSKGKDHLVDKARARVVMKVGQVEREPKFFSRDIIALSRIIYNVLKVVESKKQ